MPNELLNDGANFKPDNSAAKRSVEISMNSHSTLSFRAPSSEPLRRGQGGDDPVECISVLAILAVIAGLMLPVMIRHLDGLASEVEIATGKTWRALGHPAQPLYPRLHQLGLGGCYRSGDGYQDSHEQPSQPDAHLLDD